MIPLAAIMSIGEKVLDKVLPDPEARAKAQAELIKVQQEGRLAELQADQVAMQETSKRWEADMRSDSTLSKNIRPATLIFILVAYASFALMSAWDIEVNEAYVKLLGEWGQLIMLAYFGGRTVEKIMEKRKWFIKIEIVWIATKFLAQQPQEKSGVQTIVDLSLILTHHGGRPNVGNGMAPFLKQVVTGNSGR